MNISLRYMLILLIVSAFLTVNAMTLNSRPPRNNDIANMADALKYLHDLDTYYGDRARSRFGKRTSLLQLIKNHLAENGELPHIAEIPQADDPF